MGTEPRTVLVTGGSGFIGRSVVPALASAGYAVRVADRLPYPDPGVLTVVGDLRDPKVRRAAFDAGPAAVVHLAAPDRAACEAILRRLTGRFRIDVAAVADQLPPGVTGADLREVVRRAVLEHGRELTTDRLRAVVAGGRWQPAPLSGNYL